MNRARYEALLRGQSAGSRKVYDCVPIGELWGFHDICSELHRRGLPQAVSRARAFLGLLTDAGLVRQVGELFTRAPVPLPDAPDTPIDTEVQVAKKIEAAPKSPMDRLAELAAKADALAQGAVELREEIANVGIEIQQQIEDSEAGMAKFRQFAAMFKDLGLTT